MRLLLVEDDRKTADYIVRGLTEAGHICNLLTDGHDALFAATRDAYEVIVADRMIPGLDGLALVKAIRAAGAAGREVTIVDEEQPTALLSDARRCMALFGYPSVSAEELIHMQAGWIRDGLPMIAKPTKWAVRDGKF